MRAKDVMSTNICTVTPDATVFDVAHLFVNTGISAAPVVDAAGKMIGLVSEADVMHRVEIGTAPGKSRLLRLLASDAAAAKEYIRSHAYRVTDIMTSDVAATGEDATLGEVAALMHSRNVKRIPVVRDGRVVGIVSRINLLQGLLAHEPSLKPHASDQETRTAVMAELGKHRWSSVYPMNVVVENGVVHLWGFVSGDSVKEACRVAAEQVVGVKRVENHMQVMPAAVALGT